MYVERHGWSTRPICGPGDYPSGGPESRWCMTSGARARRLTENILAPDIYLPQYAQIVQTYAHNGQIWAFNPKTEQNANTCWNAFTELKLPAFFALRGINTLTAH